MNHDYYEHYHLWLSINSLDDTPDNWYRFIDEEFNDKEGCNNSLQQNS